ncbi:hypothetical protein [Flavisolibacter nicotianae]|uniref:hypothetical protein n=1 Tax=Flavisolibacter nicotianae TaxID=2364882 RepID=UPI0013C52182|nr:hypothetical protein [Flavisolibacter nicotianae]
MSDRLQIVNRLIKQEADEILYKKGLREILHAFGTPHVHGSYALDLMTWRDLDIYLQADNFPEADFFLLGAKICTVFQPVKMSFRNERIAKTQHLPTGLYWGIYLGDERAGAWKIDLWAVDRPEYERLRRYQEEIKKKLTPARITSILAIKSQCWSDPGYRRVFTSADIYDAVLEKNVCDTKGFRTLIGMPG